jgi:hypothetical protein
MKINITQIAQHGTIAAAIEAAAAEHDSIASGVIGSSFSTSGPGSGWSRQHDVNDFAARALSDEYGAGSYIDSSDGREATLDEEGDLEWSDESVIELITPTLEEALEKPEAFAVMLEGAQGVHGVNVYESEWSDLAREVASHSEEQIEEAMERIGGSLSEDGESVIYYDDATQSHYLAPVEDLPLLAFLMHGADEEIAGDAYSHWCAGTSHPECDEDGELID